MKIDLVYSWVNDRDDKWREKRDQEYIKFIEKYPQLKSPSTLRGRYSDHGELKYSIRSVLKYIPWINHIYIVTDKQIPEWLNPNSSKITVVDHKQILPPWVKKPTFNSNNIGQYYSSIPGLSEHYLTLDDDCFIGTLLPKEFFYTKDGVPLIPVIKYDIGRLFPPIKSKASPHEDYFSENFVSTFLSKMPRDNNPDTWVGFRNAYYFGKAIYGEKVPNFLLLHTPRPYRKSIQTKYNQQYINYLKHNSKNQFRSDDDIWLGYLKIISSIIKGEALPHLLNREEVVEFSMGATWNRKEKLTDALGIIFRKYIFLSISEGATSKDSWWRWLNIILKIRFPKASPFEK